MKQLSDAAPSVWLASFKATALAANCIAAAVAARLNVPSGVARLPVGQELRSTQAPCRLFAQFPYDALHFGSVIATIAGRAPADCGVLDSRGRGV